MSPVPPAAWPALPTPESLARLGVVQAAIEASPADVPTGASPLPELPPVPLVLAAGDVFLLAVPSGVGGFSRWPELLDRFQRRKLLHALLAVGQGEVLESCRQLCRNFGSEFRPEAAPEGPFDQSGAGFVLACGPAAHLTLTRLVERTTGWEVREVGRSRL